MHFHLVNELNGRKFGDRVLRSLGWEIQAFLEENGGIASRVEGDRLDIYCKHVENYQALLDRFQNKLNEISRSTCIRLRMGVMPWQEGLESGQAFDRALTACNMVRGTNKHLMIYQKTSPDFFLIRIRYEIRAYYSCICLFTVILFPDT